MSTATASPIGTHASPRSRAGTVGSGSGPWLRHALQGIVEGENVRELLRIYSAHDYFFFRIELNRYFYDFRTINGMAEYDCAFVVVRSAKIYLWIILPFALKRPITDVNG